MENKFKNIQRRKVIYCSHFDIFYFSLSPTNVSNYKAFIMSKSSDVFVCFILFCLRKDLRVQNGLELIVICFSLWELLEFQCAATLGTIFKSFIALCDLLTSLKIFNNYKNYFGRNVYYWIWTFFLACMWLYAFRTLFFF